MSYSQIAQTGSPFQLLGKNIAGFFQRRVPRGPKMWGGIFLALSALLLGLFAVITLPPMPDVDEPLGQAAHNGVMQAYLLLGITMGVGLGAGLVPILAGFIDRGAHFPGRSRWVILAIPPLCLGVVFYFLAACKIEHHLYTDLPLDALQTGLLFFGSAGLIAASLLNEQRPQPTDHAEE